MISGDKSDPHSGSESSSEDLSQHSTTVVTSSTASSPILAAFASSASVRRLVNNNDSSPSTLALASSEAFNLSEARNHNIAHFPSPQNTGIFPNGGHIPHGGLHMMATNYGASPLQPDSPERNGGPSGPVGLTEANRKRAVRLQKNREAARECRRKKKEYIKCLENRVAVLENQNKALIEELRSLKELYSGKNYGNHDLNRFNQRLRSCDQD